MTDDLETLTLQKNKKQKNPPPKFIYTRQFWRTTEFF